MDVHHGKPERAKCTALVACMALIAPALCACSGLPSATSSSAPYANLNEPPPSRDHPSADQEAARTKAELSATRDAAQQQAFH